MSFGTSVGEFVKLGKKAWDLYQACFNAPEVFRSAAQQCFGIHAAIEQTQRSLFELDSNDKDRDHEVYVKLSIMTSNCHHTLTRLEKVLRKYKGLGTSGHNLWDTTRFALGGVKDELAEIRSELGTHLTAISLFLQNIHYDRLQSALRRSESARLSASVADRNQKETWYLQVPAFPSSLQAALRMKKKTLLDRHSLTQDWGDSIVPLTAAEQSTRPSLDPEISYSLDEQWLSVLPEGWQRVWLNAVDYQYRYVFRPKLQISSRAYDRIAPFETLIQVEVDELPPGWERSTNVNGVTHYFQQSTGKTQLGQPLLKVQDLSEEHIVG